MGKTIIEVVVTEPLGTNCRKLIYNASLVAEKLGLDLKITNGDSIKSELGAQIVPPFILIGDLTLGKNTSAEKLEQILKEQGDLNEF